MSNVTPIRPDTCQEWPRSGTDPEYARRIEVARAFFSRDVNTAVVESITRERDTLKTRLTLVETELRTTRRDNDKTTRNALDTGRIQGMVACSCFVAIGLAIASMVAL